MSDGVVKILDGNTFVVSDETGDIEASLTDPDGALFLRHALPVQVGSHDQRPAARRAVRRRPAVLRDALLPRSRHGTVYIDAKLSVIRQRSVATGFHEDVTILNHADKSVTLDIRIEAASDFADLFEVKDALKKKGRTRRAGAVESSSSATTVGRSRGRPRSRRRSPRASTARGSASGPGPGPRRVDDGPRCRHRPARRRAGVHRGPAIRHRARARMARNLDRWISGAPRIECDWDALKNTYRRSLVDLAALRFSPPIAGGRSAPGRGAALVHDDVRPRQHLHEPAGVAVHSRARWRRRCAHSATGRASVSTTSATRTRVGSCTRCATAR